MKWLFVVLCGMGLGWVGHGMYMSWILINRAKVPNRDWYI